MLLCTFMPNDVRQAPYLSMEYSDCTRIKIMLGEAKSAQRKLLKCEIGA